MKKDKKHTVLAIGDLHCDSQHPDAFEFLAAIKKKYKPDIVVCMGDEIDAQNLSSWPQDPDQPSAGDELTLAIKELKTLYKIFPDVFVCTSNHTGRIFRKAAATGLPTRLIKSYADILEAPKGWKWADSWEFDGVEYIHGEGFSGKDGALKAAMQAMQPVVIGHIHSFAGINFYANSKHLIWGFNVGCLIDNKSPAFNYAKNIKAKAIIGVGLIVSGVPQFIPMQMDQKGRWTGKL